MTDLIRQALISPNIVHYSDLLSHEGKLILTKQHLILFINSFPYYQASSKFIAAFFEGISRSSRI